MRAAGGELGLGGHAEIFFGPAERAKERAAFAVAGDAEEAVAGIEAEPALELGGFGAMAAVAVFGEDGADAPLEELFVGEEREQSDAEHTR